MTEHSKIQTSASVSYYGSQHAQPNMDSLSSDSTKYLGEATDKQNERLANLKQAVAEPDLKLKHKLMRKNKLDINVFNNICPHCKQKQGWGPCTYGPGWGLLVGFAVIAALESAVFVFGSLFVSGFTSPFRSNASSPWQSAVQFLAILAATVLLIRWRRGLANRIYDSMTLENIPTVFVDEGALRARNGIL